MFQVFSSVMNSEYDSTNLFLKVNVKADECGDLLFDIVIPWLVMSGLLVCHEIFDMVISYKNTVFR
jgi:hypothetical protein